MAPTYIQSYNVEGLQSIGDRQLSDIFGKENNETVFNFLDCCALINIFKTDNCIINLKFIYPLSKRSLSNN